MHNISFTFTDIILKEGEDKSDITLKEGEHKSPSTPTGQLERWSCMGQYDSTQDVPFIHADTTIEAEGGFTLVSVDQNSSALIKPVEHSTPRRGKTMDEKMDECPKQTCNISNYRRRTTHWVTCDHCGQWFHQYCVGLNPSKLKKLKSWLCATCIG